MVTLGGLDFPLDAELRPATDGDLRIVAMVTGLSLLLHPAITWALAHQGKVVRLELSGWPRPLPPAAKYALTYVYVQAEFGVCCPLSMTDALTRTIRKFADPALVARYLPGLTAQDLDVLTQGSMFMTEQGAGSDISATAVMALDGAKLMTGSTLYVDGGVNIVA